MELAIIKTGGKQYIVSPKQTIKVEKLEGEEGDKVEFAEVLLFEDKKIIEIGKPFIKGAKVTATISKQDRGKKVIVFKYKAKKRYQKKAGHRQFFTEVQINEILAA
ncbi:MAG TPA: 50S ribosomal protein L21 [Candidatus Paceibacterota bacterium]|nr:50S ribosomal protein L21 [Candidatus Paceibacterota bacterium]